MKKLAVVVSGLLVLTGCSSVEPENVSYPVQTEKNVQNSEQPEPTPEVTETEYESESIDAPIVEEEAEEQEGVQKDVHISEPEEESGPQDEIEYVLSGETVDDGICKLRENSGPRNEQPRQLASSFPALTHANSLDLTGKLTVQVVFMDWANLQGTEADFEYHIQQLSKFEDFYYMVSEGKLNIEIEYQKEWIEVGTDYLTSYVGPGEGGGNWRNTPALQEKLDTWLTSVDPKVDFSNNKVVVFAVPRAKDVFAEGIHEFPHAPGARIEADGTTIYAWFAGGTRFMTPGQDPLWVFYAHEFGHALGIPDLRDMTDAYKTGSVIRGEKWMVNPMGDMDIMDAQSGPTITINAWTRWVQGWLDDSQVTCALYQDLIGEQYYKLNQLNRVGATTKALIIKTSATTALIVESRRWDSRFDVPIQNSRDGVVVYRLDSTLGHEEGPLRLYSPRDITEYLYEENTWPDWRALDVFLFEGQSLTAQGITVEFVDKNTSGDIVKISRSE